MSVYTETRKYNQILGKLGLKINSIEECTLLLPCIILKNKKLSSLSVSVFVCLFVCLSVCLSVSPRFLQLQMIEELPSDGHTRW